VVESRRRGSISSTDERSEPEARERAQAWPARYLRDFAPLLGHSVAMQMTRSLVEAIADTNASVLIRGESGVGKDIVARAIHEASKRHAGPFVKVNCAALPLELLESELFGHERGAFTGAHRQKRGQFEYADKGTIFLDEIGELPLALQAKLLHVLQDFRFSRIGGQELITSDTRLIAATNRDLEAALTHGEFREDLYYRLNVVEITIPPLRERREEIPHLTALFLARFNAQYGRVRDVSPSLMDRLVEQPWTGNVRELENTIRRFVVLPHGEQHFDALVTRRREQTPTVEQRTAAFTDGLREIARRGAREAERRALVEVLERVSWNRAKAARILRVSYKTLLSKIAECELTPPPRSSWTVKSGDAG
jgi:two-component system, NtrC family, response regulator AtoC